jgi:thioesterase domain-containing protein
MDPKCAELQAIWHRGIPIAAAMGIRVADFSGQELLVRAPLEPNINVHGTAFAGSLYTVCALSGWGMTWLQLRARGLEGSIVLAEGRITYSLPVTNSIACRCRFEASLQERQLRRLSRSGKSALTLASTIAGPRADAVSFEGVYVVRLGAREA